MKKVLALTLFLILSSVSFVFAEVLTLSGSVTPPPVTITKNTDLSLTVTRVPGQTTYSSFTIASAAQFKVTADINTNVNLTVPSQVTLTRSGGTETANLNLTCRRDTVTYPADSLAGTDCGTVATTSATGELYLSLFPSSMVFASDTTGTYAGTVTISVNY